MQILDQEGLEALTLRKCAARVGVSNAAPTHHFENLKDFKTVLATRGYATFDQMMLDEMDAARPDISAQLLAMVRGYVRFSIEHNAMFNLIVDRPENFVQSTEWLSTRAKSRKILTDMAAQFEAGSGGAAATEIAIFAMTHGYAKLVELGRVSPGCGDERDIGIDQLFELLQIKPIAR